MDWEGQYADRSKFEKLRGLRRAELLRSLDAQGHHWMVREHLDFQAERADMHARLIGCALPLVVGAGGLFAATSTWVYVASLCAILMGVVLVTTIGLRAADRLRELEKEREGSLLGLCFELNAIDPQGKIMRKEVDRMICEAAHYA